MATMARSVSRINRDTLRAEGTGPPVRPHAPLAIASRSHSGPASADWKRRRLVASGTLPASSTRILAGFSHVLTLQLHVFLSNEIPQVSSEKQKRKAPARHAQLQPGTRNSEYIRCHSHRRSLARDYPFESPSRTTGTLMILPHNCPYYDATRTVGSRLGVLTRTCRSECLGAKRQVAI